MMDDDIKSYRDLRAWQSGIDIAANVYRLTQNWPKAELYGLTSQIRRAATSIPANIAEGYGRHSSGSYIQFLKVAQRSLKELETHLILASRVAITTEDAIELILQQTDALGRMLFGPIRKLSPD